MDLDHVLSDAFHRDNLIGGEWDDYHRGLVHDQPVLDMVRLLEQLNAKFHIVGLTARPEKWRTVTMTWLLKHGVQLDELLMRPHECYLETPQCKLTEVARRFGPDWREQILCVIDDHEHVIEAFRAAGVTAMRCFVRRG